ncbi:AAA family ATPase [Deinococcus sp. HMF7604]|uniref:AAA family ATPase n=1 Tax=Deinococcus betulae TaxID=2873312 RepID=UPI001CCCB859|nr:AAA family ATPase [Deinococcus betulae]MBZ9752963.1 AAA family ATPase [Deinococcus betulae]
MPHSRRRSQIPSPVRGEIPRTDRVASAAQILLLTAPSGYGKTVLSAQLARQAEQVPLWVRVTRDAADPRTLGDLVARALQGAGYAAPEWAAARQADLGPDSFSDALLADLSAVPDDLFLVLDNAEHLSASSAALLATVLEQLPSWHRAVISITPGSHLNLTRLIAAGQTQELGADSLRFTLDETQTFLGNLEAHDLPPAQQLQEQTDGWAAALALVTARGGRGDTTEMMDHLLGRMAPALRDLVLRAAVEPLWDSQTPQWLGLAPAPDWLREVSRAGLPIHHEDAAVRPHSLVVEALDRILARDSALYAAVHQHAAQQAEAVGDPYRALGHALQAQNFPLALSLVDTHLLPSWQRHSSWELAAQTLELFPQGRLTPVLLAFLGLAYGEIGRGAEAQQLFSGQLSRGQETAITYLGLTFVAFRANDLAGVASMAEQGLRLAQTPYEKAQLHRALAVSYLTTSRPAEAQAAAQRAQVIAEQAGDPSLLISAKTVEFWALTLSADTMEEAITLGTGLLHDALTMGFINKGLIVIDALIDAMIDVGRLDEVQPLAAQLQAHVPSYSYMHGKAAIKMADLAMLNGHPAEAAEHYQQAVTQLKARGDRLWEWTAGRLYLAAIAAGTAQQVDGLLDEAVTAERAAGSLRPWLGLVLAARHLVRGEAEAALALLDTFRADRDKSTAVMSWQFILYDYLVAQARWALGRPITDDLRRVVQGRHPAGTATVLRLCPPQLWDAARDALRLNVAPEVFGALVRARPAATAQVRLRLQTLGAWETRLNGTRVKIPNLSLELLAYLLLHGPSTIDHLGHMLAPRSRDGRGRIHRAKADVQRTTGLALLETDAKTQGGLYRVSPGAEIQLDALEVLHAKDAGVALALMRGPFLPGAAAEGWAGEMRERLTRRAASLYEAYAATLATTAPDDALVWYRRAVRLTPWDAALWEALLALSEELGLWTDAAEARTALQELAAGDLPTVTLGEPA